MKGALFINLGSPKSTKLEDIKSYLDEFLMDEWVVGYPYWLYSLAITVFPNDISENPTLQADITKWTVNVVKPYRKHTNIVTTTSAWKTHV